MRPLRSLLVLTAAPMLALVGCRDPKITTYRAPKDSAMPMPAGMAANDSGAPEVHWDTPAGWQEQPPSAMRKGSFLISDNEARKADMSVTVFPGTVGGDLANVNRWRNQIQLPPVSEAELAKTVGSLELPAGHFNLIDLTSETAVLDGKAKARILGAWLKQDTRTWFFKLSGNADLVEAQVQTFRGFLKTVQFTSPAGSPGGSPGAVSTNSGGSPMGTGAPVAGALSWTAPAQWTPKPLDTMRKGSFTIHGEAGTDADLSIISFPGDAGGLAKNLNRWRGQIQLPELPDTELAAAVSTIPSGSLRFTLVDFVGKGPAGPTRIVGAVLPLQNETYFFKLMGPDALVEHQKPAFVDFLKTVKTP